MYAHHIEAMADRLIDEGFVGPNSKHEIVTCLREYWVERVADVWQTSDIKACDETLTDDQATAILHYMLYKRDAEIGINWEYIRARIDSYKDDNPEEFDDDDA